MAVGTVGGVARVHPTVRVTREMACIDAAVDLASVTAAVGLAQNLAALRAMAAEGIQRGHMRLHSAQRSRGSGRGRRRGRGDRAQHRRPGHRRASRPPRRRSPEREQQRKAASRIPDIYKRGGEDGLLTRFSELRASHWPAMDKLMRSVVASASPDESTLVDMCAYHMETGGKRLRALLPLLVAEALEMDIDKMVPLGAACEMLHNATLVHDDLQDGDLVRRGRMTVWNRFGVPQAINLGDAMFYYAVLLVQTLDDKRVAMARRLLVATLKVIDGQEREFLLKQKDSVTLDDYFAMVEGKTSGLFALPMAGAAELAGASSEVCEGIEEAARHMGVLFQIQDDALDLFGDKGRDQVGTDIAEGKRSVLVVHALNMADDATKARLSAIVDKDRTETSSDEIAEAIDIVKRAGSLDYALAEIRRRKDAALTAVGVADNERLSALVGGICALFLKPIAPLMQGSGQSS